MTRTHRRRRRRAARPARRRRPLVAPEALRQLPERPRAAALRPARADPAAAADVVRGSPAAAAGERHGDELVRADDELLRTRPERADVATSAGTSAQRWPLTWRGLYPRERWLWFEQLWSDVCMLRERYRLAVRSGWWDGRDPGRGAGRARRLGRALRLRRVGRPAGQARAALRPRARRPRCSRRQRPVSPRPRPAGVRALPDRARLPAAAGGEPRSAARVVTRITPVRLGGAGPWTQGE